MSSIKSCPGLIDCYHPLSHQSIRQHRDKYGNDDELLELYLQSQMDIVTQERLLEDYNKAELQFIIPLDLNGHDLIMSSSPTTNTHCSFEDYTKDKSALIMKGLGPKGRLISYVFNHPIKQLKRRHSSIFLSSRQQEQLVAFRYPKTVDVHTLRSITIRYLIGLSPPYLSQKHVP